MCVRIVSMNVDIDNHRYSGDIDGHRYSDCGASRPGDQGEPNVTSTTTEPALDLNEVQQAVRDRYAGAALAAATAASSGTAASGCCDDGCCSGVSATAGLSLYDAAAREGLPDAAILASLGCGNPVAVAELHEGETVLDLGSGGGIDVLLSARRVGPTGHAIGVDMTDEMLDLARRNAVDAGASNVEFRKGTIEALPVADASVDVVISNCVINLASDKGAVFAEIARVLRPGGRMGVSDIVSDDTLTAEQRAERGSYVECIAGALSFREFRHGLRAAGLTEVELVPTHQVVDGMHSVIVRATKPV
jgi:arsenite methyltransferase